MEDCNSISHINKERKTKSRTARRFCSQCQIRSTSSYYLEGCIETSQLDTKKVPGWKWCRPWCEMERRCLLYIFYPETGVSKVPTSANLPCPSLFLFSSLPLALVVGMYRSESPDNTNLLLWLHQENCQYQLSVWGLKTATSPLYLVSFELCVALVSALKSSTRVLSFK